MFKFFLGVAHRLHLVICNGLGLWLRRKQKLHHSNESMRTTIDLNENDSDSDGEDYSDDFQISSDSNPNLNIDSAQNSIETHDETGDNLSQSTNDIIDDQIHVETSSDEESNNLSMDVGDNWHIDVIDDLDESVHDKLQESIGAIMKKCRSLVKLLNKSSILKNKIFYLKEQLKIVRSLRLDCKNRWNSTYCLIKSMLTYKKVLSTILSDKYDLQLNKKQISKLTSLELDHDDWKLLEMMEYVLKPFIHATTMISGSKYPTIGTSYFAVCQIQEFLEETANFHINNWPIVPHVKFLLMKQMQKYFVDKEDQWRLMKVNIFENVCPICSVFSFQEPFLF